MKYKTFSRLVVVGIAVVVLGIGALITSCISQSVKAPDPAPVTTQSGQNPQPQGGVPAGVSGGVNRKSSVTTEELKVKIGKWLADNPDRHGQTKQVDILPAESFKATAIRFPQSDAIKWSDKDSQWSQIRIDLDRDGRDDEKWLLKNGGLYKREVLDSAGNTTFTEYFK